jgi:CRP-like cAMP-binding protein
MGLESRVAQPLSLRLQRHLGLTAAERDLVLALPFHRRTFRRGDDIVQEGERIAHCAVVLSGMIARYKLLPDDRRQILAFSVAGDMPDLQALHIERQDHAMMAIGPSELAFVARRDLARLLAAEPRIAAALWRETLIETSISREWMARIGRRDGYARVAHLACEIVTRATSAGLSDGVSAAFPPSQAEIGDALGLTPIYVNQILKHFRVAGLMAILSRRIDVLDWAGLVRAGDFDPAYLHLPPPAPERRLPLGPYPGTAEHASGR